MMERYVMAYRAPLYGRATAQLHLQPMDFPAARQFVSRYSTPTALTTYAIVGGDPGLPGAVRRQPERGGRRAQPGAEPHLNVSD